MFHFNIQDGISRDNIKKNFDEKNNSKVFKYILKEGESVPSNIVIVFEID